MVGTDAEKGGVASFSTLGLGILLFCRITASIHTEALWIVIPYGFKCLRASTMVLRTLTGFSSF